MDKRMQKILDEFNDALAAQDTLNGMIETVMDLVENEYLVKKKLLREVFTLAPEHGRMEAMYVARIKAQKSLERFLVDKIGKDPVWAEKKSFLAVNAVLGVVEMYIFVDETKVTHEDFKSEMTSLMKAFWDV
jgi:hypothetical protein